MCPNVCSPKRGSFSISSRFNALFQDTSWDKVIEGVGDLCPVLCRALALWHLSMFATICCWLWYVVLMIGFMPGGMTSCGWSLVHICLYFIECRRIIMFAFCGSAVRWLCMCLLKYSTEPTRHLPVLSVRCWMETTHEKRNWSLKRPLTREGVSFRISHVWSAIQSICVVPERLKCSTLKTPWSSP